MACRFNCQFRGSGRRSCWGIAIGHKPPADLPIVASVIIVRALTSPIGTMHQKGAFVSAVISWRNAKIWRSNVIGHTLFLGIGSGKVWSSVVEPVPVHIRSSLKCGWGLRRRRMRWCGRMPWHNRGAGGAIWSRWREVLRLPSPKRLPLLVGIEGPVLRNIVPDMAKKMVSIIFDGRHLLQDNCDAVTVFFTKSIWNNDKGRIEFALPCEKLVPFFPHLPLTILETSSGFLKGLMANRWTILSLEKSILFKKLVISSHLSTCFFS